MAKAPAFAKAFAGRWRIVEMDAWDNDVLDLGEEAHLSFEGASSGAMCPTPESTAKSTFRINSPNAARSEASGSTLSSPPAMTWTGTAIFAASSRISAIMPSMGHARFAPGDPRIESSMIWS